LAEGLRDDHTSQEMEDMRNRLPSTAAAIWTFSITVREMACHWGEGERGGEEGEGEGGGEEGGGTERGRGREEERERGRRRDGERRREGEREGGRESTSSSHTIHTHYTLVLTLSLCSAV
jgi:hypothetical protein